MKAVPEALLEHYRSGSTTLARLWRVVRTDEQVFAFTDHDSELTFEGTRYRPTSSFDMAAVSTRAELNVDNSEATGVLDDEGITAEDIEAGRWDGASIELREVSWADLSMGANILRVGQLGQARRLAGQYQTELRGLMQALQNNIGRIVNPTCDANLGDARCGVALSDFTAAGVVTAVTSRREFTVDGPVDADGYYSGGKVTFADGVNVGISMEVKTHTAIGDPVTGALLVLQLPMPFAVEVGDALSLVPGCAKTKEVCKAKFNNVLNFRGFSFVPGQDKVLLFGGQ